MLHRNVIAALGVLATIGAACSSGSSGPSRPVAKAGQIVTVMSDRDGGLVDTTAKRDSGGYDSVAVAPDGTIYVGSSFDGRVVEVPRRGKVTTLLDCHVAFPDLPGEGKLRRDTKRCASPQHAPRFSNPFGLAVDAKGTLYVTDIAGAVWGVRPSSNTGRFIAGGLPSPGLPGSNAIVTGPARQIEVVYPGPIVVAPDGTLYFADAGRVVKLGPDGMVTVVAGNGKQLSGYSGDGGPATEAAITARGLALDKDGNLYIGGGTSIRRVDSKGIITTIAGGADAGDSGDGGPASAARFKNIVGLAIDNGGNLFVADIEARRVRRIATDGTISAAAGTANNGGDSGDGGAATQAHLASVGGIAVDNAGNLYIAEISGTRVRMVGAPVS